MSENRAMFHCLSLLTILVVSLCCPVYAMQTTTQTVVNAELHSQVVLDSPDSLMIPYERPPKPASQVCTIGVTSNADWKLSIKASNNGYMYSEKLDLSLNKPMEVQYTGDPKDKKMTLTGAYQLYRSGSTGVTMLPTTFYQNFVGKDKPGTYNIDIYYLWELNF
ncbi:MAG: hypothetical protein ACP5PV_05935 [Methanothrix sp.]